MKSKKKNSKRSHTHKNDGMSVFLHSNRNERSRQSVRKKRGFFERTRQKMMKKLKKVADK